MLIISKFHDYYDTVRAFGIDKTVVYERKERALKAGIELPFNAGSEETKWYRDKPAVCIWSINRIVVGFCGELYPVSVITHFQREEMRFSYSLEEYRQDAEDMNIPHGEPWWSRGRRRWRKPSKSEAEKFYEVAAYRSKLIGLFVEHNTPVFAYPVPRKDESTGRMVLRLVLNPALDDVGFYRVKPPAVAFQEIYMYISGVLGTNRFQQEPIPNRAKIEAKGFDYKTSFRKQAKG